LARALTLAVTVIEPGTTAWANTGVEKHTITAAATPLQTAFIII
jgi:hypothetical protein